LLSSTPHLRFLAGCPRPTLPLPPTRSSRH